MAEKKELLDYRYLPKEDYDKKLKINGEKVPLYSGDKLDELYPEGDYVIKGETREKKKQDRKKDLGRIELAQKWLYVSKRGRHSRLFRREAAYAEVEGGGFIALLKTRLLVILLLFGLLLGCAVGSLYAVLGSGDTPTDSEDTPAGGEIVPIEATVVTITGTVTKDGKPIEDASLSLQSGNEEIATATTDAEGKYLINDVKNGNYNLVCTCGNSTLTKIASVWETSIVVNFTFPADDLHDVEEITDVHEEEKLPVSEPTEEISDVKAIVKITDGNTPPIAVGGLSEEAMLHMIVGKEVDLTFLATQLSADSVPAADKAAIEALSGELEMTWYDFSVLKEIFKNKQLESSEYLTNTKTVLEIAVPFDSSRSVATYAFRYHGGEAVMLEELSEQPTGNYRDGTCYITNDAVYIYTNCFSTYAIGAANAEQVVRGADTITYSDQVTVNLTTNTVALLYKHGADSSHAARVEVYLVGTEDNLLIAESGEIPVGYQLTELTLTEDSLPNMPSVGTYEGLMRIVYLGDDDVADTNVEIPLTVAITK